MVRRRHAIALIAAAAILAAVALVLPEFTLAAWRDDERSTAEFTAGAFQSQSQTAGSLDWASYPEGSPAELSIDGLSGLAPGGDVDTPTAGDSQYFWLNLRTAPGSHWSGEVYADGSTATGDLAAVLEYRLAVRDVSTEACTSANFSGVSDYWVPATTSLTGDIGIQVGADSADPVGLCFEIRVAASGAGQDGSSYQGTTADLTWTFSLVQSDDS